LAIGGDEPSTREACGLPGVGYGVGANNHRRRAMDYVDRVFTDEDITLDGNTFTRCIFDGCVLRYNGGSIHIVGGLKFRNGANVRFGPGVDALNNPLRKFLVKDLERQGFARLTDDQIAADVPVTPKHDTC
jgi:hypothetical protein